MRLVVWFSLSLLIFSPTLAASPTWLHDSDAIRQLVEGQTHYRLRSDGTTEIEYQAPDGRTAYLFDGCLYGGRWWIEDRQVCFSYSAISGEAASCFWLRQDGERIEFWDTSQPRATGPLAVTERRVPGNVEELVFDGRGDCADL